ncbi:MAG: hypothetical protein ACFFBD_14665 [Candidatus Hodarchaeota archaeon]
MTEFCKIDRNAKGSRKLLHRTLHELHVNRFQKELYSQNEYQDSIKLIEQQLKQLENKGVLKPKVDITRKKNNEALASLRLMLMDEIPPALPISHWVLFFNSCNLFPDYPVDFSQKVKPELFEEINDFINDVLIFPKKYCTCRVRLQNSLKIISQEGERRK